MVKVKEEMEKARKLRNAKTLEMAKRATERYDQDANYRFLHDQVSSLFAELLKADIVQARSSSSGAIKTSLASIWCPSVDST